MIWLPDILLLGTIFWPYIGIHAYLTKPMTLMEWSVSLHTVVCAGLFHSTLCPVSLHTVFCADIAPVPAPDTRDQEHYCSANDTETLHFHVMVSFSLSVMYNFTLKDERLHPLYLTSSSHYDQINKRCQMAHGRKQVHHHV